MALKLRLSGGMIRCGRCGKRYTNPLTHVCVTSRKQAGRTRAQPKVSLTLGTCPRCSKPVSNPLT